MLNFVAGFIVCALIVILILAIEMRFLRKETTASDKVTKWVQKYTPKEKGIIITPLTGFNKAYKEKVIDSPVDVKLDGLFDEEI